VRTVAELVHDYQHVIDEVRLVMGSKGAFEVTVDGEVLFSKQRTGRHAAPGEVLTLFRERYAQGVAVYER
jgi:selenoprotein W-related protein